MNFPLSLRPALPLTASPSAAPRPDSGSCRRAALLGALALLGSARPALAQDAAPVRAGQTDAHTLAFTVENPARQRVHLQVVAPGSTRYLRLVNEVNHRPSYGTKLSFKQVPAGEYAVLLNVGRERYRYHVQVPAAAPAAISVRELSSAPAPIALTAR